MFMKPQYKLYRLTLTDIEGKEHTVNFTALNRQHAEFLSARIDFDQVEVIASRGPVVFDMWVDASEDNAPQMVDDFKAYLENPPKASQKE